MNTIEKLAATLEAVPARSAWSRGVKEYAAEILENVEEDPGNARLFCKELLNGAADWVQYSCGGCSLIYDGDIARRLCTPSELKRTDYGRKNPNRSEQWLDTQARALYQAADLLRRCYEATRTTDDSGEPLPRF